MSQRQRRRNRKAAARASRVQPVPSSDVRAQNVSDEDGRPENQAASNDKSGQRQHNEPEGEVSPRHVPSTVNESVHKIDPEVIAKASRAFDGCLLKSVKILGGLIATGSALFGIIFGWQQYNKHKAIEFRFIGKSPYLNPSVDPAKDLKLYYRGKEVVSPQAMLIKVMSSGTEAIRTDDYDQARPITLRFSVPVLNAEIAARSPPDLIVSSWAEGTEAVVKPSLLNPTVSPGASKPATDGRFKTSHSFGVFRIGILTLHGSTSFSKSHGPTGFLCPLVFESSEPGTERG
jgi:hypothetical protein